jgi:hypothetical protein
MIDIKSIEINIRTKKRKEKIIVDEKSITPAPHKSKTTVISKVK